MVLGAVTRTCIIPVCESCRTSPGSRAYPCEGRVAKDEARGPRLPDHPRERAIREPRLPVPAADIGVDTRKPDLLEPFAVVRLVPQGGSEAPPFLVDGDGVASVRNAVGSTQYRETGSGPDRSSQSRSALSSGMPSAPTVSQTPMNCTCFEPP